MLIGRLVGGILGLVLVAAVVFGVAVWRRATSLSQRSWAAVVVLATLVYAWVCAVNPTRPWKVTGPTVGATLLIDGTWLLGVVVSFAMLLALIYAVRLWATAGSRPRRAWAGVVALVIAAYPWRWLVNRLLGGVSPASFHSSEVLLVWMNLHRLANVPLLAAIAIGLWTIRGPVTKPSR